MISCKCEWAGKEERKSIVVVCLRSVSSSSFEFECFRWTRNEKICALSVARVHQSNREKIAHALDRESLEMRRIARRRKINYAWWEINSFDNERNRRKMWLNDAIWFRVKYYCWASQKRATGLCRSLLNSEGFKSRGCCIHLIIRLYKSAFLRNWLISKWTREISCKWIHVSFTRHMDFPHDSVRNSRRKKVIA